MVNKLNSQILISRVFFILLMVILLLEVASNAHATPAYMSYYGAPSCTSCHTSGAYTKAEGQAGLAAFLAAKSTPTCTPPQVLQNNVCVNPTPTCTSPQVLQNNVCVTPPPASPTCAAPQILQDNVCILPTTAAGAGTMVRMRTSKGVIDIRLFDTLAPLTVANFFSYVDSGAYSHSFIHRSAPGFVIQGGGYVWTGGTGLVSAITTKPSVTNEFSANRSNVRGTIAMAKLAGDPNSATSQWFFNLANNAANLDTQNGGFTVFGQVVEKGMSVVDAIAGLPTLNYGGAFTQVPFAIPLVAGAVPTESNLVSILSVSTSRANINASGMDRLFDYLEAVYPEFLSPANDLSPANTASTTASGYYYRYYPDTNAYVGAANGTLYYLGPATQNQVHALGALTDWIAKAMAAGY